MDGDVQEGPVRSDLVYAQAAARYLELVMSSASPTADLAREMIISPSQARDILHQARQRELLTKTRRGQAGGRLTEKALRILERTDGDSQETGK